LEPEITEEFSTQKLEIGDVMIVRKGNQYWLLNIKEVNPRIDNSDNYIYI